MTCLTFQINSEHAKITEVVRGLFISGVCALSPSIIKEYRITTIINTTEEVPKVKALGNIRYTKLWIEDNEHFNIYPLLELQSNQIQAILASGGRILIHSVHGVSRCAAICLAYLTKFRCKSLKDAYEKLAAIRVVVAPNVGFWRQLIAFEQEVKQTHGSVHIVRDQNDPSKLVPDVYATINKSSIKSIRQSETDLVSNETKSNVSDSTLVSTIENTSKKCANDIRRSLNRSEETEKRNRRRINYARRNSTRSAKFEPILETLHERLDVAA